MHSQKSQPLPPDHGSQVTVAHGKHNRLSTDANEFTSPIHHHTRAITAIESSAEESLSVADVPTQSKHNVIVSNHRQDLFTPLPAEVRNRIYELCLTEQPIGIRESRYTHYPVYIGSIAKWTEPALLQTSKFIRDEATRLYYANNTVTIHLKTSEFPSACRWLTSISRRCGARPFRFFRFMVMYPRWDDLAGFQSLARLYFDTTLELANPEIADIELANIRWAQNILALKEGDPDDIKLATTPVFDSFGNRVNIFPERWPMRVFRRCSMFLGAVQQFTVMLLALQDALELGRKARQMKWPRARFELELATWLEDKESTTQVRSAKAQRAGRRKKSEAEADKKAARERGFAALLGRT
ncbi:uncharacterized protein K489DRAFT_407442 [Dissoconium aciculare CBS 342.82]|uniref:Uncharacterized protein n=1 Tax=Dissoconium aciculare CBS 342.82 TaxID=1314786 RepID=A0A6J3MGD4_9PEZI|nr:uncharacterized protein K489DRAFT_407442 [Dissoconium aciculare CBS 342.82]KAF1826739.1 hypothetical protein K489DRAFT_407442 [Dissoconium aciculare CBS 342.82]